LVDGGWADAEAALQVGLGGDDEPIGRAGKYRHNLTVVRERA
jgi:hypothetical protein